MDIAGVRLDAGLGAVIGGGSAKKLAEQAGLTTVRDLLMYFPRRYVDFSKPDSFAELVPGDYVTIVAQVVDLKTFGQGRKTRTVLTLSDGERRLDATFFNQPFLKRIVPVGSWQLFSGEVGEFRGRPQLTHPDRRPVDDPDPDSGDGRVHLPDGLTPVYPASRRLKSWEFEAAIGQVLRVLAAPLPDPLPADLSMVPLSTAFAWVHQPSDDSQWRRAMARFRFEVAFVLQTIFAQRRHSALLEPAMARPPRPGGLKDRFIEQLPFALTAGQVAIDRDIARDLGQPRPMHRLLQGEVGSGKTVVALLAMLQVVDAGGQAALLAPTEVLASQHHRSITSMLGPLAEAGTLMGADDATRVTLLTGSMGVKARQKAMLDIASGQAGIVIGTHALLEETVHFAELALVVIDEQHRFGVDQRAALSDRSALAPHVLVMTATPIPRTLAMTIFGDLDTSTLTELPAGRQPIQTTVVAVGEHPHWVERAWHRISEEVARGRQAYVVASRIGVPGERTDALWSAGATTETQVPETVSALELYEQLATGPLAHVRIGLLHGRLSPDDKDAVMEDFNAGNLDVLVATTVVEVGVDVPNATVMVVMDADRFGVSQLHQLRGRIGRGSEPGLCLLVTQMEAGSEARGRLDAVASTTDGFELSRFDVEQRGEGDVLGARQSGFRSSLGLLSVVRDEDTIILARQYATDVVAADPDLRNRPALAAAVRQLLQEQQAEYLERS